MQVDLTYLVSLKDIDEFLNSFENHSPFSLKNEYKNFTKKCCFSSIQKAEENLAKEIKVSIEKYGYDTIYKIDNSKVAIVKLRIRDESSNRGKSGGWRIIGLIDNFELLFILLSIYNHSSGKDDITPNEKKALREMCIEYSRSK